MWLLRNHGVSEISDAVRTGTGDGPAYGTCLQPFRARFVDLDDRAETPSQKWQNGHMPSNNDDCLFCQIVNGSVPSNTVFEDDRVFAFMDTSPINPGHLLVIPKHHAAYLEELDPETGAHMFRIGQLLAKAIRRSGLRCEGVNILMADGEAAFQEIFHAHLHVFPRFVGDSFRIDADWQRRKLADLEESANQIRSGLQLLECSTGLTSSE